MKRRRVAMIFSRRELIDGINLSCTAFLQMVIKRSTTGYKEEYNWV